VEPAGAVVEAAELDAGLFAAVLAGLFAAIFDAMLEFGAVFVIFGATFVIVFAFALAFALLEFAFELAPPPHADRQRASPREIVKKNPVFMFVLAADAAVT
jgi:hypothetical protein